MSQRFDRSEYRVRDSWLPLCAALTMVLLALIGCEAPPVRTINNCPSPPLPECKPGSFSQVTLDTTRPEPGQIYTHIVALPTAINSRWNENQLTFIPDGRGGQLAILSSDRPVTETGSSDGMNQRLFSAKMLSTTAFGALHLVWASTLELPLGAASYSKADKRLYVTSKAHNDDPNDFDLYSVAATVIGDSVVFSDTRIEAGLSERGSFDAQPALTDDGLTIYFASDRAGGQGGVDLWYSTRSSFSAAWSAPVNLGTAVNTACDELSPYLNGQTLHFSSNGHSTVGGYDLFTTKQSSGSWQEPVNSGKPVNTASDEIFPVALNDTAFFYSSSRANSEAGLNIFTITRERLPKNTLASNQQDEAKRLAERERERMLRTQDSLKRASELAAKEASDRERERLLKEPLHVSGQVTLGRSDKPAAGTELFVTEGDPPREIRREVLGDSATFTLTLNKGQQYEVGAESENAFFDVHRFDLRNSTDTASSLVLQLPDTLVLRINFPFDDFTHPYKFVIDEDGNASSTTWQESIDRIANSAKRSLGKLAKLVVVGHTDSMGTDTYNDKLGLNRATFVAKELEKRGVPKGILSVLSKGRAQPVARRPDESDELFRLRSRRVEFIKVFQ